MSRSVLERRKETRKRGLAFHTPVAVPLSPQLRLVDNDSSFTSLQDIYEKHCEEIGIGKDDPIMAWVEKMRSTWDGTKGLVEFTNLRMELMDEISTKMVPDNILSRFMIRSMATPSDLWLMRKQFTLQMASTMFLTYVLFVSARLPSRIHISRSSGQVTMSDLVPSACYPEALSAACAKLTVLRPSQRSTQRRPSSSRRTRRHSAFRQTFKTSSAQLASKEFSPAR